MKHKSHRKTKKQTKRTRTKRSRTCTRTHKHKHSGRTCTRAHKHKHKRSSRKHIRIHRMHGGDVEYTPPPGPTPNTASVSDISKNNHHQNTINHSGGRKRKQKGGMGPAVQCNSSSVLNSADGFGYIPPAGCIQVPVVKHGQELAIASVHISATGQANSEFDSRFAK